MMGIKMIDDYYINVVERRIFLFYTVLFDEKIFEIKPSQILIQMLTNNSNYLSGNRDKLGTRDYLKKKKSQQAFLMKAKLNSQLTDQLKYLQTRKSQTKLSSSLLEIEHKDSSKRLASLEITQPDAQLSQFPSNKQGHSRNNKNIGHCWSERNINLANDAAKLQKYRKFSSNAEIRQQCQQNDSHKRKLSLVDYPNQKESINKIHKYPLMAWLLILRKIFIEEQKKRNMKIIKLPSLLLEIGKVQEMNLQLILAAVQSFEYEIELTKAQIIAIIESTFTSIKKNKSKTDTHPKVCYMDIVNCLIKFQQKNPIISKQPLHKSTSSEEDVQTARFQQGNISQEMRKRKQSQKKTQLQGLMPKMQTHKSLKQNGKQNVIASVNINNGIIFKNSSIPKSKQSLNPSTSPVCKEKGSIQNSRIIKKDEGSPFILKKSGFQLQGSHSQSLGMLSIEGKSPRELMVSQIYQSMHKQGIIPQSNVSFSLQNLDMDNHYSFQQTVRSFEDFLKKIESIQKSYRNRIQNQLQAKADEQINLFLQQLINYRIATSNQPFGQENCSYLVSFDNLGEVKQHNRGIMQALIQSNSLKEYFASIQGIKFRNCPHLLRSVSNLFHNGLRIINISHNNLKKLNNLFENISSQNSIQFFNISNNNITDITPILQCCPRLKQLHCNSNSIQQIRHVQKVVSEQLKIVDLSDNKIEIQDNLIGLVGLPSIVIINIDNNPITRRDWKIMWNGSISLSCIYQMQNLYVMSSYGHQKDITFSIDKNPPKTQKDRYSNTELIRQFSISQTNKIQISNQSLQQSKIFIKSQIYQLAKPPTTKNQSRQSEPKQKISKIKAFIDGKVI